MIDDVPANRLTATTAANAYVKRTKDPFEKSTRRRCGDLAAQSAPDPTPSIIIGLRVDIRQFV
jgi:hypothetical protein